MVWLEVSLFFLQLLTLDRTNWLDESWVKFDSGTSPLTFHVVLNRAWEEGKGQFRRLHFKMLKI